MPRWTARDIPSQAGKVAVVTGSNSGIGYFTALELARAGAKVWLVCRDTAKGEVALKKLQVAVPTANVKLGQLDLADLSSVRAFADTVAAETSQLDILVLNAGVMAIPKRTLTKDGFEMQFGTNHLGHFALTAHLLPLVVKAPSPRIVVVSSNAAKTSLGLGKIDLGFGKIDLDNLDWSHDYRAWGAYSASKVANLLFMRELYRKAQAAGSALVVAAAHPGYSATNLQTAATEANKTLIKVLNGVFAQSAEMGALPSLYAATSPDAVSGEYYGPSGITEMRGYPTKVLPPPLVLDEDLAASLWKISEELTSTDGPQSNWQLLSALASPQPV